MLDTRNLGDNAACYVVRRNCSISPNLLGGFFVILALISLLIASGFALLGAWVVLPFAAVELVTLVAAFVSYARHAADYERISVGRCDIEVEVCDGDCVHCHHFNPEWSRLVVHKVPAEKRLALRSHGKEVEVGRYLDESDRMRLEQELRRWLRPIS